jgi:hypothetical protein
MGPGLSIVAHSAASAVISVGVAVALRQTVLRIIRVALSDKEFVWLGLGALLLIIGTGQNQSYSGSAIVTTLVYGGYGLSKIAREKWPR